MFNANNSIFKVFDRDNSGIINYFELYPFFLLNAFVILYYIIINDITILLILKKSKLFLLFFGFLIIYGILYIIDYNNLKMKNKITVNDTFYYYLNIINLIISFILFCYLLLLFI
jgi:hypothetical protein